MKLGKMMAKVRRGILNLGLIPLKLKIRVGMVILSVMMPLLSSLWTFLSKVLSVIMIEQSEVKDKSFELILYCQHLL